MLFVALAEAAVLVILIVSFAGLLRSQQRAHARREDLLMNQMLNLAGKPWQTSPAASEQLDEWRQRLEDARAERREWTTSPEQAL